MIEVELLTVGVRCEVKRRKRVCRVQKMSWSVEEGEVKRRSFQLSMKPER